MIRRLDSLEGLRFVSSAAIVAGHYAPYVANVFWIAKLHLAVDLFFVISGIVIAERYADRIEGPASYLWFIRRRVARIYPLHLATFGFYLLIGVLIGAGLIVADDARKYNMAAVLPNLLMVHAWLPSGVISFNYVSWSISAEFFAYLLFPVIAWAIARRGPWASLAGIGGLLIACAIVAERWLGQPLTELTWTAGILRALPGFAFGVWLSRHASSLGRSRPNAMRVAFYALWLPLVGLGLLRINDYPLLLLAWSVVAAAFLCDRGQVATILSHRWISAQGKLTYSIYMLQTVIATIFLAALFPRLFGTGFGARLAGVLLALPILYVAARLSYRYFENPLRRAIGRGAPPGSRAAKEIRP